MLSSGAKSRLTRFSGSQINQAAKAVVQECLRYKQISVLRKPQNGHNAEVADHKSVLNKAFFGGENCGPIKRTKPKKSKGIVMG